ncbi:MAG: hypothetical protein ACRCZ0_06440 [Cetobacterium sp.]
MPTYINESNYMQMNRPRPYESFRSNQLNQGLIDRTSYGREAYELDCKQVLQHIQECPVCQHIFALKTPLSKIMTYNPAVPSINSPFPTFFQSPSAKIEISVSTLILLAIFIVIFLIYIIKTSRS